MFVILELLGLLVLFILLITKGIPFYPKGLLPFLWTYSLVAYTIFFLSFAAPYQPSYKRIVNFIGTIFTSIWIFAMVLLFLSGWVRTGAVLILLGALSNILVIAANGLKMPVINNPFTAERILTQSNEYILIDGRTRLRYLADIVYTPWIIPSASSVGDICIIIGMYTILIKWILN